MTAHAPQNRVVASDIEFALTLSDGSALTVDYQDMLDETDRFSVEYVPEMKTTRPAGTKKPHHQLTGVNYQVTIEGGQFGSGWVNLGTQQWNAAALGKDIPTLTLTRTVYAGGANGGNFKETLTGGIISRATNSETTNNEFLTTTVTVDFETYSATAA